LLLADHTESKEYKQIPRKLLSLIYEREYKKFQIAIILTKKIGEKLKPGTKKLLIEGGINISDFDTFNITEKTDKLIIMYAGLLSEVTGVDLLLDMMKNYNNKNVVLKISGKGELVDRVIKAATNDSRIIYLGYLDQASYLQELKSSNILINPRNMKLPQNQNNFPSKVLDYLATGKIVISTYFSGFELFKENFIFFDGDISKLTDIIDDLNLEYSKMAYDYYNRNKEFSKKFDWEGQSKSIVDFINKNM